ncbi:Cyclin-dependent kinase-like 2 [Nymphon striatum]|nr:Cyclin-dependent kinase-like 2 [Nymphon striatum]KAG1714483.1 Cyclin-dependent kinase-like 2 [Nymphon striatum]
MDKYDNLGLIGEGSYGLVMKCMHRESGQIVAIKKFLETDDDKVTKRIAIREVRMLKQLRHENLVNLIEVFRRKRRLYLVFEYVDHTILDELESKPNGLDEQTCRQYIFQVIHRDIKPENVLVSKMGVIKLCDFGFARTMSSSCQSCTDYVATRWYRAPELLVGDTKYGKDVDIWAIGCLLTEMLSGEPLFPGESDIDQIYLVIRCLGLFIHKHQEFIDKNPMLMGLKLTQPSTHPLEKKFDTWSSLRLNFIKSCIELNPSDRPSCEELMSSFYFTWDNFPNYFLPELKKKINEEFRQNPLLKRVDSDTEIKQNKSSKFGKTLSGKMSSQSRRSRHVKDLSDSFNKGSTGFQHVFPSTPSKLDSSHLFGKSSRMFPPGNSVLQDDQDFPNNIVQEQSKLTRSFGLQDCSMIGHPDYESKKSLKQNTVSVDHHSDLIQPSLFTEVSQTGKRITREQIHNNKEDFPASAKPSQSNEGFTLPTVSGIGGGNRNIKSRRGNQNFHPISTQALHLDLHNSNAGEFHNSQSKNSTPSPPYATNYGSNLPYV